MASPQRGDWRTGHALGGIGPSSRVQSVERAALLLRALTDAAGPDATASALAAACGLNRTTAWRILSTLEAQGLVCLEPQSGTYSLGPALVELAGHADEAALTRSARLVLPRVATQTGEAVGLAVVRRGTLTYVVEAAPDAVVAGGWQSPAGSMHATCTGKVMLAFAGLGDVRQTLGLTHGARLPRHTGATITSLSGLEGELARTRAQGYAVSRGEFEAAAWGVAAPVLDDSGRPVAAVGIWGPGELVEQDRVEQLGAAAVCAATEIARGRTEG